MLTGLFFFSLLLLTSLNLFRSAVSEHDTTLSQRAVQRSFSLRVPGPDFLQLLFMLVAVAITTNTLDSS